MGFLKIKYKVGDESFCYDDLKKESKSCLINLEEISSITYPELHWCKKDTYYFEVKMKNGGRFILLIDEYENIIKNLEIKK